LRVRFWPDFFGLIFNQNRRQDEVSRSTSKSYGFLDWLLGRAVAH
jgi:hypothetical protein